MIELVFIQFVGRILRTKVGTFAQRLVVGKVLLPSLCASVPEVLPLHASGMACHIVFIGCELVLVVIYAFFVSFDLFLLACFE